MALIQNVLILAVLCILAGALTQAAEEAQHNHGDWSPGTQQKPHEHNHEYNHEYNHEDNHEHNHNNEHDHDKGYRPTWVSCDFTLSPRMRCQDCHTRLICKRVGGLLFHCPSPYAPYCNNGLCSRVPSTECA